MKIFKKSSGFTLIELLVVIAVIGVLAAGVIAAIDPLDKINAANDSRAQSDVGVEASSTEAYATSHSGYYPSSVADLVSSGDLKSALIAPNGYTYTYTSSPANCTAGTTCTSVVITAPLKSKKFTNTPFQRYESSTGKTCQVATDATACP